MRPFRFAYIATLVVSVVLAAAPQACAADSKRSTLGHATTNATPIARERYDFSVTRELLPEIAAKGELQHVNPPGWTTVVEAKDLSHGGAVAAYEGPLVRWLAVTLVIVGLTFLYWPQVTRAAGAIRLRRGHAPPSLELGAVGVLRSAARRFANFTWNGLRRRTPAPEAPDITLQNAADQVAQALAQIEKSVGGLKDGSPLRDVLEQELRLIHFRIGATNFAALNGHDNPEKSAARFRGLVRELERVRRIAESAAASVADPRDRLGVPHTRSEAYTLLGVNPDASAAVLKKLIDALRMTWHPDHARDESDRLLREERIKQINIAWELIHDCGQA